MKKTILLILVLIVFNSCNKKRSVENYLKGFRWQVTEMNYKDNDYEPFLIFSSFNFEENNKCSTPVVKIKKGFKDKKDRFAKWYLLSENKIKIESVEEYLNGEFNICLSRDLDSKSIELIIQSKKLYIRAYRLFGYGYDDNLPIECKSND